MIRAPISWIGSYGVSLHNFQVYFGPTKTCKGFPMGCCYEARVGSVLWARISSMSCNGYVRISDLGSMLRAPALDLNIQDCLVY